MYIRVNKGNFNPGKNPQEVINMLESALLRHEEVIFDFTDTKNYSHDDIKTTLYSLMEISSRYEDIYIKTNEEWYSWMKSQDPNIKGEKDRFSYYKHASNF